MMLVVVVVALLSHRVREGEVQQPTVLRLFIPFCWWELFPSVKLLGRGCCLVVLLRGQSCSSSQPDSNKCGLCCCCYEGDG